MAYRSTRQRERQGGPAGKWLRRLAVLAGLYVVFNAGICWFFVRGYRGSRYMQPEAGGVPCKKIEFRNERGQTLRGIYSETPGRPCVILMHGYRASLGQMTTLYRGLYMHSHFAVLAFDFRGCGTSDGTFSSAGAAEAGDVRAAIDFVRSLGVPDRDIGIVGFDMGGIALLGAASEVDKLGCAVIIGAGETPVRLLESHIEGFGLPAHPTASLAFAAAGLLTKARYQTPDILEAAHRLRTVPALVLGATDDTVAGPGALKRLFAAIPTQDKRLALVEAKDHADLVGHAAPQALERVMTQLRAALNDDR